MPRSALAPVTNHGRSLRTTSIESHFAFLGRTARRKRLYKCPATFFFLGITIVPRGGDYGGDGGTRPPTFWLGGRKGKCPPLIAHLVKFLGLR